MKDLGKMLIVAGVCIAVAGLVLWLGRQAKMVWPASRGYPRAKAWLQPFRANHQYDFGECRHKFTFVDSQKVSVIIRFQGNVNISIT